MILWKATYCGAEQRVLTAGGTQLNPAGHGEQKVSPELDVNPARCDKGDMGRAQANTHITMHQQALIHHGACARVCRGKAPPPREKKRTKRAKGTGRVVGVERISTIAGEAHGLIQAGLTASATGAIKLHLTDTVEAIASNIQVAKGVKCDRKGGRNGGSTRTTKSRCKISIYTPANSI
jgi:hypothetical protein